MRYNDVAGNTVGQPVYGAAVNRVSSSPGKLAVQYGVVWIGDQGGNVRHGGP